MVIVEEEKEQPQVLDLDEEQVNKLKFAEKEGKKIKTIIEQSEKFLTSDKWISAFKPTNNFFEADLCGGLLINIEIRQPTGIIKPYYTELSARGDIFMILNLFGIHNETLIYPIMNNVCRKFPKLCLYGKDPQLKVKIYYPDDVEVPKDLVVYSVYKNEDLEIESILLKNLNII